MQIPNRILEAINANELNAQDYYSVYGKDALENELSRLRQSDSEIFEKYSVSDMKAAVQKKIDNRKKRVIQFPKAVWMAAAAIFAFAVILPVTMNTTKSAASAGSASVRVKGGVTNRKQALSLYRYDDGNVQKLSDGDYADEGDVIQIAYNAGNNKYGVIFSVDGNGNITRHFPENSWNAQQLKGGAEEIPLDFSYQLDSAPEYECFIMVTSEKSFSLEGLEKNIKSKKNLRYIEKMGYLPKSTEGVSFLLKK